MGNTLAVIFIKSAYHAVKWYCVIYIYMIFHVVIYCWILCVKMHVILFFYIDHVCSPDGGNKDIYSSNNCVVVNLMACYFQQNEIMLYEHLEQHCGSERDGVFRYGFFHLLFVLVILIAFKYMSKMACIKPEQKGPMYIIFKAYFIRQFSAWYYITTINNK